jgi:hypothetical protein
LGVDLQIIWTCEIEKMLDGDKEMRSFFDGCLDYGPISLRDAYFGGILLRLFVRLTSIIN